MAIYAPDQFFLSERGFRKLLKELPTPFLSLWPQRHLRGGRRASGCFFHGMTASVSIFLLA